MDKKQNIEKVTSTKKLKWFNILSKFKRNKKNAEASIDNLKKEIDIDEHKLLIPELCIKLKTDAEKGLSEEFAKKSLEENGPNSLTPPKETPEIIKFLKQMASGFSILLWIGAALSILAFIIQHSSDPTSPFDSNI